MSILWKSRSEDFDKVCYEIRIKIKYLSLESVKVDS